MLDKRYTECGHIRKEIPRSSNVGGLDAEYDNFGKSEERASMGVRPPCLGPIWFQEQWRVNHQENAEILGIFFADKLTAWNGERIQTPGKVWKALECTSHKGHMRLEPPIPKEEVRLAARDLPEKQAVGQDLFPAELYKKCGGLRKVLEE